MIDLGNIAGDVEVILRELADKGNLGKGKIVVIGTSTSEVMGKHIGTAGAQEAASRIYKGIEAARQHYGFYTAFQCCEHLNRALVIEKELLQYLHCQEVSAVPISGAGGSMAAHAYRHFTQPVLIENIQADGGIDIGDTFIGMHLKAVAVPFRPSVQRIGHAHVTAAYTRPKLIGGQRAVYTLETKESNDPEHCL